MNAFFKTNDERKVRRYDNSIHKAMRISDVVHQTKS